MRHITNVKMCLIHFLLFNLKAVGATLTLSAVSDTSIFENKPDANLGATTLLSGTNQQASRSRGMFRFDLSSLPLDAIINGVQVSLYCTRQPDPDQHGGPIASDFSLYRLFVDWGEGGGSSNTGSVASAGDATWNERHFLGTSWGTPGGLIGTDYANNSSATTAVGNIGAYVWGSSTELISDVQTWLAAPSSNFGFMLVNQSEALSGSARRFASREQSDSIKTPPKLTITYSIIPEPSIIGLIMLGLIAASFRRQRISM